MNTHLSPVGTSVVPIKRSPRLYGPAPPNTPTLLQLDDLRCTGNELSLLDCDRFTNSHRCQHSDDAGVQCGGTLCVFTSSYLHYYSLYSLDVYLYPLQLCAWIGVFVSLLVMETTSTMD